MKKKKIFNIIGIMTGTSMDGIDISYISTDGINKVKIIKEKSYQYSINEQIKIKKINITNVSKKSLIIYLFFNKIRYFSSMYLNAICAYFFCNLNIRD